MQDKSVMQDRCPRYIILWQKKRNIYFFRERFFTEGWTKKYGGVTHCYAQPSVPGILIFIITGYRRMFAAKKIFNDFKAIPPVCAVEGREESLAFLRMKLRREKALL